MYSLKWYLIGAAKESVASLFAPYPPMFRTSSASTPACWWLHTTHIFDIRSTRSSRVLQEAKRRKGVVDSDV